MNQFLSGSINEMVRLVEAKRALLQHCQDLANELHHSTDPERQSTLARWLSDGNDANQTIEKQLAQNIHAIGKFKVWPPQTTEPS